MTALATNITSSPVYPSPDCSSFMNWTEGKLESAHEKVVVFLSLVATLKYQPVLDVYLEAKAVRFLDSVDLDDRESKDAFLTSFGRITDESLTTFTQSVMILVSSASQDIIAAAMKMLSGLILWCSTKMKHTLLKADLIPQLINTLNPLSLSLSESVDILISAMKIITNSIWFATPDCLAFFGITDPDEQQTVHETVFMQVLAPSEKYICHFCVNRFSIVDGEQSLFILTLLAILLEVAVKSDDP